MWILCQENILLDHGLPMGGWVSHWVGSIEQGIPFQAFKKLSQSNESKTIKTSIIS